MLACITLFKNPFLTNQLVEGASGHCLIYGKLHEEKLVTRLAPYWCFETFTTFKDKSFDSVEDAIKLFESKGMAPITYQEQEIVPAILYLLKNPSFTAEIKNNMKENFYPNAAATIIDDILAITKENISSKENPHEKERINT